MSSLGNGFYENLDSMIASYKMIDDIGEKEKKLKSINEFIEPALLAIITSGNDLRELKQNTVSLASRILLLHKNFSNETTQKTEEMREYLRDHGPQDLFYSSYAQVVNACENDLDFLERKHNLLITIYNNEPYKFLEMVKTLPKEVAAKGLAIISEDEQFRQSFLETIQGAEPEQLKDVINVYSNLIGEPYNKSVFFAVMELIPTDKRVKFFETGKLFEEPSSAQRYKLEPRKTTHSSYIEALMKRVNSPTSLQKEGDHQRTILLESLRLFSDYPKAAVNYMRLGHDYNHCRNDMKLMIEGRDNMAKNGDFINQLFVFAAHFSYWIPPTNQMSAIFKNPEQYSDDIITNAQSLLIDLGGTKVTNEQIRALTIPIIEVLSEEKSEEFIEIFAAYWEMLKTKIGMPHFDFSAIFKSFLQIAFAIPKDLRPDVFKLYREAGEPFKLRVCTEIMTGTTPEQREKIFKMANDIKSTNPEILSVLKFALQFPEFENKVVEIASIQPFNLTKFISIFSSISPENGLLL